jgi:mannosylfructose-phosphate synthase
MTMPTRPSRRIMMISLHGYVSADAEMGKPDTGGQVVYVLRLSECLARLGYKVDIFTRRFEGQPEIERISERVRIVRVPAGGPALIRKEWLHEVVPEWVSNATAWIARHELRYAFIDSHYWDAGLAGGALAPRLGIPHLHTPHSIGAWKRDNMDGDPAELEREYNFSRRVREERIVYDEADAIIATTPQQRELLVAEEYGVEAAKIVVVPPGYDDSRFYPVSTATRQAIKRDVGIDGPLVLALGRVAANKGYDLLLEAMPTVVERVPGVQLLLAIGSTSPTPGEVRQVDDLRALAEQLGIADHVRFHDYVPDEELADTYRAADVFALSSRYEPFGMTAVEAMACGTPAVVTTQGGLWEMVTWGTEALYADPNDPQAFGHALATVLQYPDIARQLARFGSHRARATFTWNGIAQRLLSVLQDVAERRRDDPRLDPEGPRRSLDIEAEREVGWLPVGSS